jgi:hypothetical protein
VDLFDKIEEVHFSQLFRFRFCEEIIRYHFGDSEISVIKVGGVPVFHAMESTISNGRQSDYETAPRQFLWRKLVEEPMNVLPWSD